MMSVSVANLNDDVRVACRKYVRSHYGVATMSRPLGTGGYNMTTADVASLVIAAIDDIRQDQDYSPHSGLIDVTGGQALADLLSGTLSKAADYILKEIVARLRAGGVEIKP